MEPQNRMVISSSRLKPSRRAMKRISGIAMPSSTAATTATLNSDSSGVLLHSPSLTASPKAE
ncbi:hypothetical protein D3C72_2517250 [compost metagenome]